MSRPSFGKMQREKDRRAKAAAKAERRAQRSNEPDEDTPDTPDASVDQSALLDQLAKLHQRYDDGDIDFEAFMEAKDDITQRLQV